MNRKAFVIGSTLQSTITIIVIVLIMGSFILLASAISLIKKPQIQKNSLLNLEKNELLLNTITVEYQGKSQTITLYEALNLFTQQKISSDQIRKGLNDLQQKTSKCYYLSLNPENIDSYYLLDRKYSRKEAPEDILFLRSSNWKGEIKEYETLTLEFSGKKYRVDRYIGECPNEK